MSGQIKYFDNGEKNMSFLIEDGSVLKKCNEIWKRIKGVTGIKFHSKPVYDDKYIKTEVKKKLIARFIQSFGATKF